MKVTFKFLNPPAKTFDEAMERLSVMAVDACRGVDIPLLSLMADDDPLIPAKVWEATRTAAIKSKHIILLETKRGGHCGWFAGIRGKSWLDQRVVEFLTAALNAEQTADRNMLVGAIEERLDLGPGKLSDLSELNENTLSVLLSGITNTNAKRRAEAYPDSPMDSLQNSPMGAAVSSTMSGTARALGNSLSKSGSAIRDYFPKTAARVAAAEQRVRSNVKF